MLYQHPDVVTSVGELTVPVLKSDQALEMVGDIRRVSHLRTVDIALIFVAVGSIGKPHVRECGVRGLDAAGRAQNLRHFVHILEVLVRSKVVHGDRGLVDDGLLRVVPVGADYLHCLVPDILGGNYRLDASSSVNINIVGGVSGHHRGILLGDIGTVLGEISGAGLGEKRIEVVEIRCREIEIQSAVFLHILPVYLPG